MPFKKGQSGNPQGKPKGAKSKLAESFYQDCLKAYGDPEGFNGYEGLKAFIDGSAHNREIFLNWLAKWAEKQMKQEVEHIGEGGGPIQNKIIIEIVDPQVPSHK